MVVANQHLPLKQNQIVKPWIILESKVLWEGKLFCDSLLRMCQKLIRLFWPTLSQRTIRKCVLEELCMCMCVFEGIWGLLNQWDFVKPRPKGNLKNGQRKKHFLQRSNNKTGSWIPNKTVKPWTTCWNKIIANLEFYAQWKYP